MEVTLKEFKFDLACNKQGVEPSYSFVMKVNDDSVDLNVYANSLVEKLLAYTKTINGQEAKHLIFKIEHFLTGDFGAEIFNQEEKPFPDLTYSVYVAREENGELSILERSGKDAFPEALKFLAIELLQFEEVYSSMYSILIYETTDIVKPVSKKRINPFFKKGLLVGQLIMMLIYLIVQNLFIPLFA